MSVLPGGNAPISCSPKHADGKTVLALENGPCTVNTDRTNSRQSVTVQAEVRFGETDLMQVVHHAAYLPWMEIGRLAYLQAQDLPYTEIARTHHFSVVRVDLQIRRSLTFGDTVAVTTTLARISTRKLRFTYRIHNARSQSLVATGMTEHICVDLEGRAVRLPQSLAARLRQAH